MYGKVSNPNEEDQFQYDLQILEAIRSQSAEEPSEVNWHEVSRKCCIGPQQADSRWKVITKKMPMEQQNFSTFNGYLDSLISHYRRREFSPMNSLHGHEVRSFAEFDALHSPSFHSTDYAAGGGARQLFKQR